MLRILIYTFFFSLLLFPNIILAQEYGVKGGFNSGRLIGNQIPGESEPVLGYSAACFASFHIKKDVFVMGEVTFSKQGGKIRDIIKGGRYNGFYEVHEDLQYLKFPISFRYETYRRLESNFYFSIGLSPGFLINSNTQKYAEIDNLEVPAEMYFPYTLNKYNIEVLGSIAAIWRWFIFELRYYNGLGGVYKGKDAIIARNSLICLQVGLFLF